MNCKNTIKTYDTIKYIITISSRKRDIIDTYSSMINTKSIPKETPPPIIYRDRFDNFSLPELFLSFLLLLYLLRLILLFLLLFL